MLPICTNILPKKIKIRVVLQLIWKKFCMKSIIGHHLCHANQLNKNGEVDLFLNPKFERLPLLPLNRVVGPSHLGYLCK
jgi:hypothetical protein